MVEPLPPTVTERQALPGQVAQPLLLGKLQTTWADAAALIIIHATASSSVRQPGRESIR